MQKTLYVFVGKSAAGKDFLTKKLQEQHPDFIQCISDTSRNKRPGEINGIDYYFKTADQMLKNKDDYWEWIEYANAYYAFSINELNRILNLNQKPFVKVTPDGYKQVIAAKSLKDFNIKTIYIDVPLPLQIKRFKQRDETITDAEIQSRIATNADFETFYKNYKDKINLHLIASEDVKQNQANENKLEQFIFQNKVIKV